MTTAIDMITRSGRIAGALGKSETPDADEASNGLQALNTMLESWSIERLAVPYIVQEQLTLSSQQSAYTMGAGGDLNTARPTRIDDTCFVTSNGVNFPLQLIDRAAYAALPVPTLECNLQWYLFVDYSYPLVTLNFYPVPNTSGVAQIASWKQLQSFPLLTTVLSLPPGYERAIVYNLAIEYWGSEMGTAAVIPASVERIANKSKANIKRINAPSPIMQSEVGYMNYRNYGNGIRQG